MSAYVYLTYCKANVKTARHFSGKRGLYQPIRQHLKSLEIGIGAGEIDQLVASRGATTCCRRASLRPPVSEAFEEEAELVDEGRLLPATVEGWKEPAYMHPDVQPPRATFARALVTPFDSLVFNRRRIGWRFQMKYTIELYTPPPKRIFGY